MIKKNRLAAAAVSAVMALSFSANAVSAQEASSEFDMYDFISESECIVLASYENKTGDEYRFRIIRTLKNEMPEMYFYLSAGSCFDSELAENGKYVLFLSRDPSVYYQHDKYTAVYDVLITADEKNAVSAMTMEGIPVENPPESVSSLKRYISEVPDSSVKKRDYIRSGSTEDIVQQSDIAAAVTVDRRISDGEKGCGMYRCTVNDCFKGDISGEIDLMLFDSKVKTGEKYYLLLNENGGEYTLSSKKSIYRFSDKKFSKILSGNV